MAKFITIPAYASAKQEGMMYTECHVVISNFGLGEVCDHSQRQVEGVFQSKDKAEEAAKNYYDAIVVTTALYIDNFDIAKL